VSNLFKRYVQHFLSFSRSDRNAIVIFGTIIFILVLGMVILRNMEPVPKSDFSEIKSIFEDWEQAKDQVESKPILVLFDFDPNTVAQQALDSLALPKFVKRNLINYRNAGGKYKSPADVRKIYGMNDSIFALIESHINIQIEKKKKRVIISTPKKKPTKSPPPPSAQ
jgi:hypothetical protein